MPQIAARAFISFQQFFIQVTKQDKRLIVENSHTVYNLWCYIEFGWKLMIHEALYYVFNYVTALYPGH